jgi:hypothetical protein
MLAYKSACSHVGCQPLESFTNAVSSRARIYCYQQRAGEHFVPVAEALSETTIICLQLCSVSFSSTSWRTALDHLCCATLRSLVVSRCDLAGVGQAVLAATLGALNVERIGEVSCSVSL